MIIEARLSADCIFLTLLLNMPVDYKDIFKSTIFKALKSGPDPYKTITFKYS